MFFNDIKDEHIGKRVLVRIGATDSVGEYNILEISPNRTFVKLEYIRDDYSRYTTWEKMDNIKLIEVLPSPKKRYVKLIEINCENRRVNKKY
jgi:hypothetical protein